MWHLRGASKAMTTGSALLIAQTTHFRVDHCGDCMVPGYLIVSARSPVRSLSELSAPAAAEFGGILARATRAIEVVVAPERVYCARFGEESEAVHLHLFPRTQRLAEQYRRDVPSAASGISGPLLLDWARGAFRKADQTAEVVQAVEACIPRLREAWEAAGKSP